MFKIIGINNCDSVRKTKKFLDANNTTYVYHDFRKDGFPKDDVAQAVAELGLDKILNKRSTTWKQLSEEEKNNINDTNILALLEEHPTLIKRPLIINDGIFSCGYNEDNLK